jgi:hypothetical protein
MDSGYRNVHLVTFGAPRVTTKSFVRKFNGLAESNARSVSIVERPDDPRIEDWTSQIEDLPTIRIVDPARYRGQHVAYRSGCADPHSGADYRARARSSAYVCGEDPPESSGGRRRIGGGGQGGPTDGTARPDRRRGR